MTADQIVSQCKALAAMHYPDDHSHEHASYYAGLLESKLREVLYGMSALQVYDGMLPAKVAAMDRAGEVIEFPRAKS